MGVRLKRAAGILALGIALGVPLGGAMTVAAVKVTRLRPPAAVVALPSAVPSIAATPSRTPAATAVAVVGPPSTAISALSGAAVVNGRIAVDAAILEATLADRRATGVEIARAIRALSADAAIGTDLAGRLVAWPDATLVATGMDEFYTSVTTTAGDAFQASLTDDAAYRKSGAEMVKMLAGLDTIDAMSRALASTVDLELPPVAGSGSTGTTTPSASPTK